MQHHKRCAQVIHRLGWRKALPLGPMPRPPLPAALIPGSEQSVKPSRTRGSRHWGISAFALSCRRRGRRLGLGLQARKGCMDGGSIEPVGVVVAEPFGDLGMVGIFGIVPYLQDVIKAGHAAPIFRRAVALAVSIRRGPPCLGRSRALLSVLLRVCFGAVGGSGDGIFGAGAAQAVER